MATHTISRRAMREQHDAVPDEPERAADTTEEADEDTEHALKPRTRKKPTKPKAPAKAKGPAKPRARKKALKAPERVLARWAVCDNTSKRVAMFEYKDRAGADAKLAHVRESKPGTYYLALVKEPYDFPEQAPAVPV